MKKINENTKITLTIGQLKKLVRESYTEDIDRALYEDWVQFIKQFGAEETAKLLSYRNISGTGGVELVDVLLKYADENGLDDSYDVSESLHKKADDEGLADYATDLYSVYVGTKYEKFLININNEGFGRRNSGLDRLDYDWGYELKDKAVALMDSNQMVFVVTHEISAEEDPEYPDDLSWESAKAAISENFNILDEGKTDKCEYMILSRKY